MVPNNQTTIKVDDIVAQIKRKAEKQKKPSVNPSTFFSKFLKIKGKIDLVIRQLFYKNFLQTISIKDLLQYEDKDFVTNCYILILNRPVDSEGLEKNLEDLRSGKTTKTIIIARLLFSPEGFHRQIKITGLIPRLILNLSYYLPLIGFLIKLLIVLIKLPRLIDQIHTFQVDTSKQMALLSSNPNQNEAIGSDSSLNSLYLDFEDTFRGSQGEILKRQKKYLETIQRIKTDKNGPGIVLDLGCGRGEWLGLLKANKIDNLGVDSNIDMINTCRKKDLNAYHDDVLKFLELSPPNSFLAVTGFHIVEHIPYPSLVKLIDLSLRALKPGGVIIFETPNPENLIVGACNFYTDPTHLNPIPPHTLQFLLKARGFSDVKIFTPGRKKIKIKDTHVEEFFNRWINISPDYAAIAAKPHAST